MRRIQSLFKTLLMLIPMTAVPVMAVFGIPQFFPVSASPTARPTQTTAAGHPLELGVGQSDALLVRKLSSIQPMSIDLFEPYGNGVQSRQVNSGDVIANASLSDLDRRRDAWRDPLVRPQAAEIGTAQTEVSLRTNSHGTPIGSNRLNAGLSVAATASGQRRSQEASLTKVSSFSGQATVPPRTAPQRANDLPTLTVASVETLPERSNASLESAAAEELPVDSRHADRYARLTSGVDERTPDSHSRQVETLTWQQAVDRLNQLGIRTFRLTPDAGPNGYRFACLVTSVDDPRISRRFEAESIDPLIAVGDVLAQVEDWNQHR